jgi:GMP synthase (glutamine-hydrolysing)
VKVLVVQHEPECPPAYVGDWLVEAGCELDVRHPYAGDGLPTLDGYAGLLVLGGAMSANDDELLGWITPTKELIRDAVAEGVPTLGICLGHQLIGAALGGTVRPNPRGRQVGLLDIGWTEEATKDELVAGVATPRRGVQWNNDVVTELPEGAVVLAETEHGEVQAARYAPTVWGVQLHPEVDAAIVATWVSDSERAELTERGLDSEVLLREIEAAREELDHAWAPLAAGFADVVLGTPTRVEEPTA